MKSSKLIVALFLLSPSFLSMGMGFVSYDDWHNTNELLFLQSIQGNKPSKVLYLVAQRNQQNQKDTKPEELIDQLLEIVHPTTPSSESIQEDKKPIELSNDLARNLEATTLKNLPLQNKKQEQQYSLPSRKGQNNNRTFQQPPVNNTPPKKTSHHRRKKQASITNQTQKPTPK